MGFPLSPWGLLRHFLTLHLLQLGSGELRVVGPGQPLLATVGQDVVLPCHLSPRVDARNLEIRWIRHQFSETVHLYRNGEDLNGTQMKEYAGRTELARGGLSSGSLDLRISGLRPSDDGQYVCTVQDAATYGEATVDLEVGALGSVPLLSLEAYEDGGIRVLCRSAGWYPSPELIWKDGNGQHLPSVSQRLSPNERGFFEIQDVIVVSGKGEGIVSCVVRNSRLEQEQASSLHISAPFFHNAHPWMAALGVFLLLSVVLAALSAFLFRRKVVQSRALEERDAELKEQAALLEQRDAALEEQASLLEQRDAELAQRDAALEQRDAALKEQAALLEQKDTTPGQRDAALAWRKFLLPENPDVVTLDPNTAHSQLLLSEDLRSLRSGTALLNLPDIPERFNYWLCVLGKERFWEGRHCWEVEVEGEVEGNSWWAFGVAKESMERKGREFPSPKEGVWGVWHWKGQFKALTSPSTLLSQSLVPRRIWVCLDCTQGLVTFLNADTGGKIFSFPPGSFLGETLRPWFWVGKQKVQLCLRDSTRQSLNSSLIPSTPSSRPFPSPESPQSPLLDPSGDESPCPAPAEGEEEE